MWLRWATIVVLGFLALHSLSYGLGFLTDPASGAGEFGNNEPVTEAAQHLAGLVGVILVLVGALAIGALVLLARQKFGGDWIALGLGVAMLAIGIYWATRGNSWDAGFYSAVGVVLFGCGVMLRRTNALEPS